MLVGTFNQGKALIVTFSVIVKLSLFIFAKVPFQLYRRQETSELREDVGQVCWALGSDLVKVTRWC